MAITVSLCIIGKNEEEYIGANLVSIAHLCDEVIFVDTGSTDKTVEIVKAFNDCNGSPVKVYDFPWVQDFAAARNFCFDKATQEFILWLDADDYISEADRGLFVSLKEGNWEGINLILCDYRYLFDDKGQPTYTFKRERVVRRGCGQWRYAIHEAFIGQGQTAYHNFAVSHGRRSYREPSRNIDIFRKLEKEGHEFDLREQFYFAQELIEHRQYEEAIEKLEAYIDGGAAWPGEGCHACCRLSEVYCYVGDRHRALRALMRGFEFGISCETVYNLGNFYYNEGNMKLARHWYNVAIEWKGKQIYTGYENQGYGDYLPLIQLCMVEWAEGNQLKAVACNDRAGEFNPQGSHYLHNKEFFKTVTQG